MSVSVSRPSDRTREHDGLDLLSAKLAVPQLPLGLVSRPRLRDQLDRGATRRVTLVSAGPGWGKTMAVAGWAESRQADGAVAWLSLDRTDNDPVLFWSYVLAAVRDAVDDVSPPLRELVIRPPLGPEMLRRVILGLSTLPTPLTLVLDDFHEIRRPDVLGGVVDLVRHPSSLRLVLVTRSDPPLHLQRLRVDGELTEIRAADLAFSRPEAQALFVEAGVSGLEQVAEQVLERTEGWAVGLRMAALFAARTGRADRLAEFTGGEDSVAEYLFEEVLDDLPTERRQFLLRTSVTDKLCGELADVLTGGTNGQQELELLERSNAFVVALGAGHRWFRYHALMADLLRQRLRLDDPELSTELDRRAARWFAARGDALEAVRHAVHARDWRLVGELMVTVAAPHAVSAEREAFAALLAEVPASEFSSSAELRATAAVVRFLQRDYPGMALQVSEARTMLNGADPSSRTPVETLLTVGDMVLARATGDLTALSAASGQLLRWLGDPNLNGDPVPARLYEAPSLGNHGVALVWSDRGDEAEPYLRSAVDVARATGADLTVVNSLGYLSLVEAGRGRLQAATTLAVEALDLAEQRGCTELAQAIAAYLALAEIHFDRGELADAQRLLDSGLGAQRNDPEWIPYMALRALQARILLARGRVNKAVGLLRTLAAETRGRDKPARVRRRLTRVQVEALVAQGLPDAALDRIRAAAEEPSSPEMTVVAGLVDLALGRPARAEAEVAAVRESSGDRVAAVEAWLVTALAAEHDRDDHRALAALECALTVAEPEGIRQPFLAAGSGRVQALLQHRKRLGGDGRFAEGLLSSLDSAPAMAAPSPLARALTDRERVVLSHMATLETNDEIASSLFVSVNTVKAHTRSIYRKLEVTNRREAIKRARVLGLI